MPVFQGCSWWIVCGSSNTEGFGINSKCTVHQVITSIKKIHSVAECQLGLYTEAFNLCQSIRVHSSPTFCTFICLWTKEECEILVIWNGKWKCTGEIIIAYRERERVSQKDPLLGCTTNNNLIFTLYRGWSGPAWLTSMCIVKYQQKDVFILLLLFHTKTANWNLIVMICP